MDIKDLLQLAGLTNNAQPHSEDSLNHNEAETMRKLVVMIDPEQLNKIASTSEPDKMSSGCGCMEDEQVEEWANSGDHVSGTPEEMTTGHGELGAAVDTSLRRYLNANGANVKVDEHVYPDHKVEDIAEAYAAFKEGKYKSDAQRRAVHAAKDDEDVKEAAKPDYIDIDGDGDKKEPMKKASKDKKENVKEKIMDLNEFRRMAQLAGLSEESIERVLEENGLLEADPIGAKIGSDAQQSSIRQAASKGSPGAAGAGPRVNPGPGGSAPSFGGAYASQISTAAANRSASQAPAKADAAMNKRMGGDAASNQRTLGNMTAANKAGVTPSGRALKGPVGSSLEGPNARK